MMTEYLSYKLTGIMKSEYTISSTTSLLNARTRNGNFDIKKLLDAISVEVINQTFDDKILITAILKLSKIERIILVFNIVIGMRLPEIATLLDIKIDNLYVRKYRAKKMLIKYIEDIEL